MWHLAAVYAVGEKAARDRKRRAGRPRQGIGVPYCVQLRKGGEGDAGSAGWA